MDWWWCVGLALEVEGKASEGREVGRSLSATGRSTSSESDSEKESERLAS